MKSHSHVVRLLGLPAQELELESDNGEVVRLIPVRCQSIERYWTADGQYFEVHVAEQRTGDEPV